MNDFQKEKQIVREYFEAFSKADPSSATSVVEQFVSDDYQFFGVYPFNELKGAESVANTVWKPLMKAFTRLQRREDVFMAGQNVATEQQGEAGLEERWVMSMGHFVGLFDQDWLGIPFSRKVAFLRYAEFFCVRDGKIIKSSFFCDIIDLMHQVGIRPLPPETGHSFVYPGPATHDGIILTEQPNDQASETLRILDQMIADLSTLNVTANDEYPAEVLERSWSKDMLWYGPAGIGASYTIARYQQQHSYPFRQGLNGKQFNGHISRFAEGNYACFFGWPNLTNQPKGGFLGLPGGDVKADMRVVDVYRREGDKLVENWVIIDLLYWLKQQGLDVLERTSKIANPAAH